MTEPDGERILLAGPVPPPWGGVAVYVSRLGLLLAEAGYECSTTPVATGSDDERERLHPRVRSVVRHFAALRRNDIFIDCFGLTGEYPHPRPTGAFLGLHAVKRFRWLKILHDASLPARYSAFDSQRRRWVRRCLRAPDELVAVNEELADWAARTARRSRPTTVISSLLPSPTEREVGTEHLPREAKAMRASFEILATAVGTFAPVYGFADAADAIDLVRRRTGKEIGLLLIDGGFDLEAGTTERRAITENRPWIGVVESVSHPVAKKLMADSDVFLRPTRHEAYGLSRVEAVIARTPVVASEVGETRGMLLHPVGDRDEQARLIELVLTGNAPARPAPDTWARQFTEEAASNLRRLNAIVDSLLGSGSADA